MTQTVQYHAVSILSSRTFWVAVLTTGIGLLAEPDLIAVLPVTWLPHVLMVVGLLNVGLRLVTVRPVAFIAPGETKAIAVVKIMPPAPAVTD